MNDLKPKPCPQCKCVYVEANYIGFSVICDCYDGAPDAGPQLISTSLVDATEAIENWNELIEEELE